jgi:hypothetical protein
MFPTNQYRPPPENTTTSGSSTNMSYYNILRQQRVQVMLGCTYRAMALFRIVLGTLLTMELCLRLRFVHAFYTKHGTLPMSLLRQQVDTVYPYICFPHCMLNHNDELIPQQIILLLQICLSMGITIGVVGCPILCFLSWYLYLSLTLRNTWLSYILDRYIHYLLFVSIFLPLNECYSVQSLYYRQRQNHHHHKSSQPSPVPKQEKSQIATTTTSNNNSKSDWYVSPATIAVKVLVAWIYFDAGYGKYQNTGWSYFHTTPLPALDTYARHTIAAQYMTTLIGGTVGWRLLTPLVVYIELLVVPLTLFGLLVDQSYIVYIAITLIVCLHLGIAAMIRNATLLSLIAITPWTLFLPITMPKSDRHNDNTTVGTITTSNRSTTIVSLLFLVPMIVGCIWFETMSANCDQSVEHVWSTMFHNRWNVFVGAEEYVTWEIAPGLLSDQTVVDIWRGSTNVSWTLPTTSLGGAPSTGTSRPGRWRSFPYLAEYDVNSDNYHALWGYLCTEYNIIQHPNGPRLIKYNFYMLQADVLPQMQFSATRKRLIVSYTCSTTTTNTTVANNITHSTMSSKPIDTVQATSPSMMQQEEIVLMKDFPKPSKPNVVDPSKQQPEHHRDALETKIRIELSPEPDFPKTSVTIGDTINTHHPEQCDKASVTRIELSPEPDFPKTSTIEDTNTPQPNESHDASDTTIRIELAPEPDFPKTSVPIGDTINTHHPEHYDKVDATRIELSPVPDFPKVSTTPTTSDTKNEPMETKVTDIRIELSPNDGAESVNVSQLR